MDDTKAALILPDIPMRDDFLALMEGGLDGLSLTVMEPLTTHSPADALADVEVIFTFGHLLTDTCVAGARRLRWIQSLGAGVDGVIDRKGLAAGVVVTNARGVHSASVPETAIALMLALARDIPGLVRAQAAHEWRFRPSGSNLLFGKTVGVLGVGAIAEGLAVRCKALGMRVEGISRRADAPFFDRLRPYEALTAAVADFDYFVLLAPLTDRTRNLVDARILAAMKPGATLINVARGGIVDEDALLRGLKAGCPAAAGLDVFAVEPLERGSPFWDLPNVLISPHSAGHHRDYPALLFPVIAANWEAFRRGDPTKFVNLARAGEPGEW